MHDTAFVSGSLFAIRYGKENYRVLDVGGQDVNGSLRSSFETHGMTYVSLDVEAHASVDVVMKPGDPFPFEDGSFDLVISTSCFEHDPCFWMTFREMCRVCKQEGFIYMNAPSNGIYHGFPGDNWRFYSDAGQALAHWSGRDLEGKSWPTKVVETFHILPKNDIWIDFVCVWQRTDTKETEIITSNEMKHAVGPLKEALEAAHFSTRWWTV